MKRRTTPVKAAAVSLGHLMTLPDDAIGARLLELVQETGVKFRSREAFDNSGWKVGPEPVIAKFWSRRGATVTLSRDPILWDLRAVLLNEEALSACAVLMWRRLRKYDVQWIGGMETASIPITAAILSVNRAAGAPPLSGFYLRKKRKPDGLRRLLEGVRPPPNARVALIDDILNKGSSKRPLVTYCRNNALIPAALLVVVDTQNELGHRTLKGVCPHESLLTRRMVLCRGEPFKPPKVDLFTKKAAVVGVIEPAVARPTTVVAAAVPTSVAGMIPEDVELVRLARDTVVFSALSGGRRVPVLGEDQRGSAGYLPFLGRYLRERGPVFTRISKREFKDGKWFNRLRGCQAVGLFDPEPATIAEMTIKSAVVSATTARKVGPGDAAYHKPIWPSELGDLSLFVYVVEELVATKASTAEQLISEGHDVRSWGLVAHAELYRGVVCGDLDAVPDVKSQVAAACRKMQDKTGTRPDIGGKVTFTRIRGRWLWDPARPKSAYF